MMSGKEKHIFIILEIKTYIIENASFFVHFFNFSVYVLHHVFEVVHGTPHSSVDISQEFIDLQ